MGLALAAGWVEIALFRELIVLKLTCAERR